jgi:hypothetical protein
MYPLTCISKSILFKPMRLNPAHYSSGIIIVCSYPVYPDRYMVDQGTRADRRQGDSHAANGIASSEVPMLPHPERVGTKLSHIVHAGRRSLCSGSMVYFSMRADRRGCLPRGGSHGEGGMSLCV